MTARGLLLAVSLLAILAAAGCYHGSRPRRIGEPAPDFTLQDSDRTVTLNQFRGQIVVLNFWGSFCPPCIEELPSLMSMQERARARGVTVIGISIDSDDGAYHRFVKERGVNFLTVRDGQERIAGIYGTAGWPETYIIDRQGILRRKIVGPTDWNSREIMEFLGKL